MAGTRIVDMPNLGAVTDSALVVGELSGSGLFSATALRTYLYGFNVATIAALRANTIQSSSVFVAGYAASGDGGGGWFRYVSTDTTSTDNGGTIIVDASSRRWYRDMDGNSLHIWWFGGNTVSNYSPLLTSALAVVTAMAAAGFDGAEIILPAKKMSFTTAVSWTYPLVNPFCLTIRGAGMDATSCLFPTTDGLTFNLKTPQQSIHFMDFSLLCSTLGTKNGLTIFQAIPQGIISQSDLTRMCFRGVDKINASNWWSLCVNVIGLNGINFEGCLFWGHTVSGFPSAVSAGFGVQIAGYGAAPEQYSLIQNFNDCDFWNLGECIIYGDYVQGMTLKGCNFTNVSNGIVNPVGALGIGAQLSLNTCQFAVFGNAIITQASMSGVQAEGCLFYNMVSGGAAIVLDGTGGQHNFVGNIFSTIDWAGSMLTGTCAIWVKGAHAIGTIGDNTFIRYVNAVNLAGATQFSAKNNIYSGCTNGVINSGSNSPDTHLFSLVTNSILIGGTYASYLLDMSTAVVASGTGIRLPNASYIAGRNQANTNDVVMLEVTSINSVRLGSSAAGNYTMNSLFPNSDNAFQLGASGQRFTSVWAVNGAIQTSDASLKTDIAPLPASLPMVLAIEPKTFRWIDGGSELQDVQEEQTVQAQREVKETGVSIVVENGIPVRRSIVSTRLEPVFDSVPVIGEDGLPVYDVLPAMANQPARSVPVLHQVPRMVSQVVTVRKPVSKPGARTHWGFLASDVKAAMDQTGLDFGGYVKAEDGTEALRPDQLVPVLWKALQELAARVSAIETKAP